MINERRCLYCYRKFKAHYPQETVCSRLCGSMQLEILTKYIETLQRQHWRANFDLAQTRDELGKISFKPPPPPEAFTLAYIREVVDGESSDK